jgi:hypothetical protein
MIWKSSDYAIDSFSVLVVYIGNSQVDICVAKHTTV